ncbi:MAG TPA: hypothetical protein VIK52_11725 [Opitutaceae bacterium]
MLEAIAAVEFAELEAIVAAFVAAFDAAFDAAFAEAFAADCAPCAAAVAASVAAFTFCNAADEALNAAWVAVFTDEVTDAAESTLPFAWAETRVVAPIATTAARAIRDADVFFMVVFWVFGCSALT